MYGRIAQMRNMQYICLSIEIKFFFLMRGDIVHGGALDNSKRSGSPWINFFLLPAIKQINGQTVAKLKQQNNNIHTDDSICGHNHVKTGWLNL